MKKLIVLFREPDGRAIEHSESEIKAHQENWKNWFSTWGQKGKLEGGSGLTLNGKIIKGDGNIVVNEIYKNGDEIVGGYLLLNATNLDEAVEIMKTCPIYEFGGYAEIRELQNQD
ncbi:hypothetical protein I5M32_10920 [Pedobacter sp. SD-b]|uniref:YCII-related domain-containing protein n=1 Tax=Pedobacter segetis TaxID=2793069 RepID=A0ABS1BKP9_9SPHI|nr:YciI family protein [Pedobacter segetis]MBK0383470.1 hypothetical protein [Pedobacter segetis]